MTVDRNFRLILLFFLALSIGCGSRSSKTNNQQGGDTNGGLDLAQTLDQQQDVPVFADFGQPDLAAEDTQPPIDLTVEDQAIEPDLTPDTTPANQKLVFIAMGDFGTGGSGQKAVASAIKTYCSTNQCDFILGLGDLIYNDGVKSVNDTQFQTKFETPYKDLDLVFYQSLGNHDYATSDEKKAEGFGNVQAMIEYSKQNDKWFLPALWYTFSKKHADFFALNTERYTTSQFDGLKEKMDNSTATWRIGFGHRPVISNGKHGNTTGSRGNWMRRLLCNRVDIYLAGHDHDLEYLKDHCGLILIVSGAGGARRTFGIDWNDKPHNLDDSVFGYGNTYGFTVVVLENDTMQAFFYGVQTNDGNPITTLLNQTPKRTKRKFNCSADQICEGRCDNDPDCQNQDCTDDGTCNRHCTQDPDCYEYDGCPCDFNYQVCEPIEELKPTKCGCDQDCLGKDAKICGLDGHCDTWCTTDPDCP